MNQCYRVMAYRKFLDPETMKNYAAMLVRLAAPGAGLERDFRIAERV